MEDAKRGASITVIEQRFRPSAHLLPGSRHTSELRALAGLKSRGNHMSIVVAGATGNLGMRITSSLRRTHDASVIALVRNGTAKTKLDALAAVGASVVEVDFANAADIARACSGASCIVSALQGLRDVIVDTQSVLLEGALSAGVRRFIPSDFSTDFTKLVPGENRNFDLRRDFHAILDHAAIAGTAIFNGAFAEILGYGTPLLDVERKTVGYWSDPDWAIDFTTIEDTAVFTASAAVDDEAPRILRIAGFQVSPRQLAEVATEAFETPFSLVQLGTVASLREQNVKQRAANPDGEAEVFPRWQQGQYMQSMFSAHHDSLDNDRYPQTWSRARDVLAALAHRSSR